MRQTLHRFPDENPFDYKRQISDPGYITGSNPTWNGYSTAEWDGDTLVVHTIGFRDDLWLDSNGNPLTESGKVTERISRPNFGTLQVEMTIEDPRGYTAPWTVRLKQPLVLDSDMLDYYCLENEKDAFHMGSSWTQTKAGEAKEKAK